MLEVIVPACLVAELEQELQLISDLEYLEELANFVGVTVPKVHFYWEELGVAPYYSLQIQHDFY